MVIWLYIIIGAIFFMQQNTTRKKNTTLTSEDIRVDRKVVTRVIMTNTENPCVIEINLSMFAIPNQQRSKDEYEEQINRIVKESQKILKKYVLDNHELFDGRSILDINFTSANLKKGYNKSVQMSLFVRQNQLRKFTKIKNNIKETIKDYVNQITSKIKEEDFKCFKKKQTVNKDI